MAVLIPVDSAGNRTILADNLPGGPRRFRTYFSQGEQDGWYLDIFDSAGNVLIRGIRCVPGCPNLVKGQGDDFAGEQLACVVLRGSETAPDALGDGTYLLWFGPGQANPFRVGDPMLDIPEDQWAFKSLGEGGEEGE